MRVVALIIALVLPALTGCGAFSRFSPSSQTIVTPPTTLVSPPAGSIPLADSGVAPGVLPEGVVPSSTIQVPALNRDYAWDQIVDVVDDYFEIDQEVRVKCIGDQLTEGFIDTFPLTGATLFEPWRRDSVGFHERLESTLQSIRRRADVRVMPNEHGYLVDIVVLKQLEAVDRPIKASAGAATFRYDTSLTRDTEFDPDPIRVPGDPARPIGPRAATSGWIDLGRDPELEQAMLQKIQGRLGGTISTAPAVVVSPAVVAPVPGQSFYPSTGNVPGSAPIQELPMP